jgi:hypothetical protein
MPGNLPISRKEEEISKLYLHALATDNRFGIEFTQQDYWGSDAIIKTNADIFLHNKTRKVVELNVQLKATINLKTDDSYFVKFSGLSKEYHDFLRENVHYILAVLALPKNEREWLVCEPNQLSLRTRMYWVSLFEEAEILGKTTAVKIPNTNILTPRSLFQIMGRLANEQPLRY